MGTRYKSSSDTKIESLEQVNLALRDIGQAEKELALIDAKANEEISKLKEKALKEGEENRKFITETVAKIQSYAEYNKSELFKDTKSLELAFGKIGYRKSTKISVKKTTVELLKALLDQNRLTLESTSDAEKKTALVGVIAKIEACIRVKEEPNKDALSLMEDSFLHEVGASHKVTNDFFCEATPDNVNEETLKHA